MRRKKVKQLITILKNRLSETLRSIPVPALFPVQGRQGFGSLKGNLFATRPSTPTFNRYGQNAFSDTKCTIKYEKKCQQVCRQEPVEDYQSFEYYPDK